jgi:hypothetical protein
MIIKCCLVFFLIWFHVNLYANKLSIGLSSGLGSYSHVEMKELQNQLFRHTRSFIPGLKMMEQFPGYYNFSGWIEAKISRHSIGYHYAHLYSGARNNVSDYSGIYNLDMLIGSNRHSASYKFWFLDKPQAMTLSAFTFARFGRTYTKLHLKEELEVYNLKKEEYDYWYTAEGKFLELGVGSVFKIFRFLEFNMTFGYDIDFSKDFRELDQSRKYLTNIYGNNISPDWSGLRLTVGVNLLLDIQ